MTNSKNQELLEIREYAIKSLREELLGPGSERGSVQSFGSEEDLTNIRNALTSSVEEEKISERPEQRYILGVLHPQEDADLSEDDCVSSASRFDDSISSSGGFKPSSMGLCFVVTRLPEKLKFIFSAGLYTEKKSDITQRKFFSRCPFSKTLEIEVGKDEPLNQAVNINNSRYEFDFYLKAYEIREGQVFCTLMVVNRSDKCVFQPKLEIRREQNDFDFISLNRILNNASTEEEKSLELLYREKENFGSGLGVSVSWKKNEFGVESIYTEFLPTVEVPNVSFDIPDDLEVSKDVLSMRYLSGLDCEDYSPRLKEIEKFLDGYDKWITEQEQRISSLEDFYQEAASRNIGGCKQALLRMRRGLELLNGDYLVRKAFQLANRGMLIQRVRLQQQKEDSVAPAILELDNSAVDRHRWRAFQLAFLLMSLNAAVNPNSEDRELVDLIWFPTGGGKTEAYLGVIAFYIILRRLQNPEFGGGTAAIMRYTLRSLSSQQFSRASTLMCALEYMRKKMREDGDLSLGSSEISIGLWVGRKQTPNNVKGSEGAAVLLERLNDADPSSLTTELERSNKFQVLRCPWCGEPMQKSLIERKVRGSFGYRITEENHFEMFCPNPGCFFHAKLPLQVVDEELYRNPPSLLFATVDKFAMLPWNEKIGNFLGHGNQKFLPPDLVVQDELHLISGSLGTMVSLYETAIDKLLRKDGKGPKIIASTATIRMAKEQCRLLFNRDVAQFPPPVIDSSDNFFSKELDIDHARGLFGRTYVGIFAPGTTKASCQVRGLPPLLSVCESNFCSPVHNDYFKTLTIFFNSLKDLGRSQSLIADDVKARLKSYCNVRHKNLMREGKARFLDVAKELTSRVSGPELTKLLNQLELTAEDKKSCVDVLLATKMISVGIDIPRLNLLAVIGQPMTTNEYIQATSRVGRSSPGLVVVFYDIGRSRDRSYYEKFTAFHNSYYKFVEGSSVTPFSKPARDRALHAVLVASLRQSIEKLQSNEGAGNFNFEKDLGAVQELEAFILDRYRDQLSVCEQENESKKIKDEMDEFLKNWSLLAKSTKGNLRYGTFSGGASARKECYLLRMFEQGDSLDEATQTMTSMRNVDEELVGEVEEWRTK